MWPRWFYVKWRVWFASRKLNNIFAFLFFSLPVHGISKIQLTTDRQVQFITQLKQVTIRLRAHHSGFKYSGMWSCVACEGFCDVVKVLLFFERSGHISTASQNSCVKENSHNNYLLQIFVKFKFFTQRTHPSISFGSNELNKSTPTAVRTWRHACNATSFACWLDHKAESALTTGTPASMFIYWWIISLTSCAVDKTQL
jgi:hypothetical protein